MSTSHWPRCGPTASGSRASAHATKYSRCLLTLSLSLTCGVQLLFRELAGRFQEPIAHPLGSHALHHHQRLVHQVCQQLQHLELVRRLTGDRRRCRQGPAAGKHRHQAEQPLLVRREVVVAPLEHRPQRLVARQRLLPSGQEPEPIVELGPDLLDRQHLHARSCQLDRQRDAIEPSADVRHRGGVRRASA